MATKPYRERTSVFYSVHKNRLYLYDDAALVRFIETNMEYVGCKVIVVMDRRMKVVERAYPEFWAFAHTSGIEVFDKGKYRRFEAMEAGND